MQAYFYFQGVMDDLLLWFLTIVIENSLRFHLIQRVSTHLFSQFISSIYPVALSPQSFFFFLTWTIFKVFVEFVTVLLLFYVLAGVFLARKHVGS